MARAQEQVEDDAEALHLGLPRLREGLRAGFGRRLANDRPALEVLVMGLAGASGPGEERAAEALKRGYRPWTRLFDAAPELVAAALRPVEPDLGRALKRAETLIAAMRRLAARSGGISLAFLAEMKVEDASAWLEDALGLAPPLIAQVLAAAPLRHRVVHPAPAALRALERLGLGSPGAGPVVAGRALAQAAPPAWTGTDLAELADLLQALGDGICHAQKPDCAACPVAAACPAATVKRVAAPSAGGARPIAYLRRRIARMEGDGRALPQAGLHLGGEAFSPAVFPHGLPFGVHQAAAPPMQGAAPLILAIAAAVALDRRALDRRALDRRALDRRDGDRREGEGRERDGRAREGPMGLLRRRPKPVAPLRSSDGPAGAVRLLMVQEIDAVMEHGEPYPPGLQALGVDPAATAFVTVGSGAEVLRVVEEALKLRAAPVLVAELRRGEGIVDLAVTRRLNLAARRAGAFLFLITPDLANTSAALTRWRIGAAPSRPDAFARALFSGRRLGGPAFTLDLVRNRLGPTGAWTVEWDLHEQRFRTPQSRFGFAQPSLPAPHLPPPVDGPAVARPAISGRAAA